MFFDYQNDDWSEAEEKSFHLPEVGVCVYTVASIDEQTSKAGNLMIKLSLNVCDLNGNCSLSYDYLVKTKEAQWKTLTFVKSANLEDKLKNKTLKEDEFVGATGLCKIAHEERGEYTNVKVISYLPYDASKLSKFNIRIDNKAQVNDGIDDDIPF